MFEICFNDVRVIKVLIKDLKGRIWKYNILDIVGYY